MPGMSDDDLERALLRDRAQEAEAERDRALDAVAYLLAYGEPKFSSTNARRQWVYVDGLYADPARADRFEAHAQAAMPG